jgi:micrococcal nuclease
MKHTSTGRVDKVIDSRTVLMKDNKIIRLLAVEYPLNLGEDMSPAEIAAKDRLEKLLPEATEVEIWQSFNSKTGRVNRMGHVLAHLVIKKDGLWVNGTLIDEGLGWTATDTSNPEMADQLYNLEDKARVAKRGLWSDKLPYGVLSAEDASSGNGSFRVVEGAIKRAATSKNNLYLNFGSDMKKDFTVMITPELRRAFSKRGIDTMALAGRTVRVRGWIREWNGPFLELETPERLEILPAQPSTDLPSEPSTEAVENIPPPRDTGQVNP